MKNHSCAAAVEAAEVVAEETKIPIVVEEDVVPVVEAEVIPAVVQVESAPVALPEPVAAPVPSPVKCAGPVSKAARTKKVEFYPNVTVVLIPSLTEYRQADLCRSLYWSPSDLRQFHINLSVALQKYMVKCAYSDKKQALKKMMLDPEFEVEEARLVF